MAKTQDFTAVFKDVMGSFPVDTKAMEDAFKNQLTLNEKMSGVALTAAGKSAAAVHKVDKRDNRKDGRSDQSKS